MSSERTLSESDFTMHYDADNTFPFYEDENADITGYGHQDPDEFAAEVNRYDTLCNGEPHPLDEQWSGEHVAHRWAVIDDADDEMLHVVPQGTPGAFPITTLWGQR